MSQAQTKPPRTWIVSGRTAEKLLSIPRGRSQVFLPGDVTVQKLHLRLTQAAMRLKKRGTAAFVCVRTVDGDGVEVLRQA